MSKHDLGRRLGLPVAAAGLALALAACGSNGTGAGTPEVVVYTSVDQQFAEPLLKQFEADTGIVVKPVYDVEASKTTGLVNRLIAEKDRPQADAWWSGEFAQTIDLGDKGILAPYQSPAAADIPAGYKDPGGLWTGFGGRARVLLVNTDKMTGADLPTSIQDLAAPAEAPDQVAMAHPVFGTSATQAAALYALWGADKARSYYQQIADKGVHILDGNGAVRDQVANGQLAWGITDTDDACGAVAKGAPVKIIVPDQEAGGMGTLVVPNTVAVVKDGPNPAQAQAFVDYLLKPETEEALRTADWIQLGLRAGPTTGACGLPAEVKGMEVSLAEVAEHIEAAKADMGQVFVR
jgi:iron(III) transport system substrate-binding protein